MVVLDGVWAPWVVETGRAKKDKQGRLRKEKKRRQVVVLVSLGIWPEREEWHILAWYIAMAEDEANWTAFLTQLQEAGLGPEKGLKLIIADGAGGIEAARQMVYGPAVPLQRCIFHKIRNVLKELRWEKGLSRQERQECKQRLVQAVAQIWDGANESAALGRMAAVVGKYQTEQPEAMATLQRDFEATLSFYKVQREAALQGKPWPARLLRTTSLLERANRAIRRAIRRGCAWPSKEGLNIRVWLGTLGYRRHKGDAAGPLVYRMAEAALARAGGISR